MVAGVDEVSERVMSILVQATGRQRDVMTLDTQLDRDLDCSPEEIQRLLARLQGEFRIDMTGYDFDRHFDLPGSLFWPVGVAMVVALPVAVFAVFLFGPLLRAVGLGAALMGVTGGPFLVIYALCVFSIGLVTVVLPRWRARREAKVPVTVGLLIEAALLRKWPEIVPPAGSAHVSSARGN